MLMYFLAAHQLPSNIDAESSAGSPPRKPQQFYVSTISDYPSRQMNIVPQNSPSHNIPGRLRRFSLPKWLPRLPGRSLLAALRESSLLSAFVSACQIGILVFLSIEIVRAARDVHREFMEEASEMVDSTNSRLGGWMSSPGGILSAAEANRLVGWLQAPKASPGVLPRSISSWITQLAADLKTYCPGLSDEDLVGILQRLSKPQAQLLQTCLMRQSRPIDFDSLEGVEHASGEILRWIKCKGILSYSSTQATASSPYSRLMKEGRQGMALWGAPGKSMEDPRESIIDGSSWSGIFFLLDTNALLTSPYCRCPAL